MVITNFQLILIFITLEKYFLLLTPRLVYTIKKDLDSDLHKPQAQVLLQGMSKQTYKLDKSSSFPLAFLPTWQRDCTNMKRDNSNKLMIMIVVVGYPV